VSAARLLSFFPFRRRAELLYYKNHCTYVEFSSLFDREVRRETLSIILIVHRVVLARLSTAVKTVFSCLIQLTVHDSRMTPSKERRET